MKIKLFRCSLIVALVTTAFFSFLLPLQTYLSNQDMFLYSVWELLPELLVYFILASSILSCLLYFLGKGLGRLPHLFVMGLCLCGYLQVSMLSIGMPQLNGELWLFQKWSIRQYLDVSIFSLVFIAIFALRKVLSKYLIWIMIALCVMQVSFCVDALIPRDNSTCGRIKTVFDDGFCPVVDMIKSLEYSENRNVIVLSLDSSSANLADEIISEDELLREHFSGFVAFSENIGMHDNTTRGVPSFATGRYVEKNTHVIDHAASFWGDDSAITLFKMNGYDMFVRMGSGSSYTNARKFYSDGERGVEPKLKVLNYTKSDPYITLLDIVKFKLVRWRRKHGIMIKAMMDGNVRMAGGTMLRRESEMYPYLLKAPVSARCGCFVYLHTEGVHVPVLKNKDGGDLPAPAWSRDAIKGNLHYLLWQVAEVMDAIKAKGIYDNTLVVISTDHGIVAEPKSALLWMKPFNSNSPFMRSDAPTSLCRVSEVLKKSVVLDLSINDISAILSEHVRRLRIRQVTPDKWWQFGRKVDAYDIFYNDKGVEIDRQNLGEFLIQ